MDHMSINYQIYIEPDFDKGYYIGTNKISGVVIKSRTILNHHPMGVFWIKKWNFEGSPPSIITNYDVANLIMAYLGVPLSFLADNIEFIKNIANKHINLTDIYISRWKLMKKLRYMM